MSKLSSMNETNGTENVATTVFCVMTQKRDKRRKIKMEIIKMMLMVMISRRLKGKV